MANFTEIAHVVKCWLTLKSDLRDDEPGKYVNLALEPEIEAGKQGLDHDIEAARQQFADLLFNGRLDWLHKDDQELEAALPQWFLPGSDDEHYLEHYATASRTDVASALNFLSARLAAWARGEGRPQRNSDYSEGTWPAGTQYCMYDGTQWLYSPVASGPGADWQTMEARASAAAAPARVDLSTPEEAQQAANDVAATAQDILNRILQRNPKSAEGIDPERMKQLLLEALKAQQ